MNAQLAYGSKEHTDAMPRQSLRRSGSQVRATRLALALSAVLLSPLASSGSESSARITTPRDAMFKIAQPHDPAGTPLTAINCNDSGPGSLRDIITNVAQSGDTVILSQLPWSTSCGTPDGTADSIITLTTGEIVVTQNDLTLQGPYPGTLSANGSVTISGAGASRVFRHTGSGTLAIKSLTVADGYYHVAGNAYGGCIESDFGNISLNRTHVTGCTVLSDTGLASGGGVSAVVGDVTLISSIVSGNQANASSSSSYGGGVYSGGTMMAKYSSISSNAAHATVATGFGGGVRAAGGATILASTIDGNFGTLGSGLDLLGTAIISNSTISYNVAVDAALIFEQTDSATITNSTIAFNHQSNINAGEAVWFYGSSATSVLTLQSSIIANNTAGVTNTPDDLYLSVGFGTLSAAGLNNLVIASNIPSPPPGVITVTTDPMLGPLQLNGGWTRTHELLPDSPALGVGNNNAMQPHDQRGDDYPRTTGGAVDIGAVQFDTIFADDFDFD